MAKENRKRVMDSGKFGRESNQRLLGIKKRKRKQKQRRKDRGRIYNSEEYREFKASGKVDNEEVQTLRIFQQRIDQVLKREVKSKRILATLSKTYDYADHSMLYIKLNIQKDSKTKEQTYDHLLEHKDFICNSLNLTERDWVQSYDFLKKIYITNQE